MKLKVLVTGAGGLLGSSLVAKLSKSASMHVCGIYHNDTVRLLPDAGRGNVEYVRCDLADIAAVSRLFLDKHYDVVIHTAAVMNQKDAEFTKRAFRSNVVATVNLADMTRKSGCLKFIYCSSISVYDGLRSGTGDFKENELLQPQSPYGWSKYAGEEYLRLSSTEKGINNTLVLRFAGIHGFGRSNGVVYNMIKNAGIGNPLIVDEPHSRFRIVFVDDATTALIRAMESEHDAPYACYNIAGEEIFSLKELSEKIVALTGLKSEIVMNQDGKVRNQVMDISKAKAFLRYVPRSLDVNLQEYCSVLNKA